MNKLIQSGIGSAVVLAVSTFSSIASATMHHVPSHVSTVSVESTPSKPKVKKTVKTTEESTPSHKSKVEKTVKTTVVKAKKPADIKVSKKKTSGGRKSIESTVTIPPPPEPPIIPESAQTRQIDPNLVNPVTKPSGDVKLPNPATDIPNVPVPAPRSIPNPVGDTSISDPNLPTSLPAGTVK